MTHHHHGEDLHPSPAIAPSLLRLSVGARMGLAGLLIAVIWAVALWAMY